MCKTERSLQTCHASYTFSCTSAFGHCLRPCAGLGRPSIWFNMVILLFKCCWMQVNGAFRGAQRQQASSFSQHIWLLRSMILLTSPADALLVLCTSVGWQAGIQQHLWATTGQIKQMTEWSHVLAASRAARKHSVHHVVRDISVSNTANFLISTCSL